MFSRFCQGVCPSPSVYSTFECIVGLSNVKKTHETLKITMDKHAVSGT